MIYQPLLLCFKRSFIVVFQFKTVPPISHTQKKFSSRKIYYKGSFNIVSYGLVISFPFPTVLRRKILIKHCLVSQKSQTRRLMNNNNNENNESNNDMILGQGLEHGSLQQVRVWALLIWEGLSCPSYMHNSCYFLLLFRATCLINILHACTY